jgi:hypothetical protein
MRSATLIFKSFIDVSLCSVDAAHMHRRGFDDQMCILLWPRLMLLAYASHRVRSFSNPPPSLGCAGHMSILKSNPTPRIFSDPGSTFPTPRPAVPPRRAELHSNLLCILYQYPNQMLENTRLRHPALPQVCQTLAALLYLVILYRQLPPAPCVKLDCCRARGFAKNMTLISEDEEVLGEVCRPGVKSI